MASRTAKKRGLLPRELYLACRGKNGSCKAMTALLTQEQHHCLFAHVRVLTLSCSWSKEMVQVRAVHPTHHLPSQHQLHTHRCWRLLC
jgi:hypothetical protein